MTRAPESEIIERITTAIGEPLLNFILNATVNSAPIGQLSEKQISTLRDLDGVLTYEYPQDYDQQTVRNLLRLHLTDTSKDGNPLANRLHLAHGGSLPEAREDGSLDAIISALATDAFPAFLLPAEEPLREFGRSESVYVSASIIRHSRAAEFKAAIMTDPLFSAVFVEEDPADPAANLYRSTFRGGRVQSSLLPSIILRNAWHSGSDHPTSAAELCRRSLDMLQLMRTALAGESVTVKAYQALAGVHLPPGTRWTAGEGVVVREATERDRERAPESLKRQLTGSDAAGIMTVINYDGDIVVEFDYPYTVKAVPPSPDGSQHVLDELSSDALKQVTNRLRLSLLIAVQRENRKLQLAPSWQYYEDLFDGGDSLLWNDSTRAIGLTPAQLTETELAAWREWYELLDNPNIQHIELALSRVMRAVSERRDPSDVLIDSVIAWENLFGSKEGEPTLRVTASLALLLTDSPQDRRKLRTKLGKIYALRSDVVHGSSALNEAAEYAYCYEALEIALRALRVLLRDRPDVLAQRTGTERSLHLIVGPAQ
ncbi:hypothetical protein [Streptomyces sp. NPDC058295]|uniref:hypothetical protein n=1 Tax=Streptomyces sp. NPDC058295 TaxID=3346431 RepID=UPI0036E23493